MIGRFNAYDFIAVVIPGIFFIWVLGAISEVLELENLMPSIGDIAQTSILIVQGYIVGLLLQGVSQHVVEHVLRWAWGGLPSDRMLLPQDRTFPEEYKRNLIGLIKRKFNITVNTENPSKKERAVRLKENHAAFRLCYRSIDKLTETPSIFNAQYGLFRCLLTMFVLLALIEVVQQVTSYFSALGAGKNHILNCLLFVVGGYICYLRMEKRAEDFSRSVYDSFYSHFSSEIT